MAQLIKCLLYKHIDLISEFLKKKKKTGVILSTCNSCIAEAKVPLVF